VSSAILTDVHFVKVSTLYPRVVIPSLAKRLENLLYSILTLPLVYGPEITTCRVIKVYYVLCVLLCLGSHGTLAMLRFIR
jgi:hypothetical protein